LGAIGAAMDCYDTALRAKERIQFDKPIGTQLQKKLAEMITEITKAQLLT
jgi:glutaryl-CoA dehydrogenase